MRISLGRRKVAPTHEVRRGRPDVHGRLVVAVELDRSHEPGGLSPDAVTDVGDGGFVPVLDGA